MVLDTEQKAELLGRSELFSGVPPTALTALAERAVEQAFGDGEYLVRQGQAGTGLWVIVSGAARVMRGSEELTRLGPGEFLGELAVIDQQPRVASVVTIGPTVALGLASWDLLQLTYGDPELAHALLRALAGRLRRVIGEDHH
ncbi:MAG: cyclic nucleotide-binding domain-containing protein [Candidatus Limnocylindrales bacterium]